MPLFNLELPKDIDNIITYNLMIIFLVSIMYMTFTDAQITIKYYDEMTLKYGGFKNQMLDTPVNYQIQLENLTLNYTTDFISFADHYREYRKDLGFKSKILPYINFFLFFILLPFMNIIYGVWCFKNGLLILPKSLYTKLYLKNRGVY